MPVAPGVLDEPAGAVPLPDGRVLVCDTNHHRLLVVEASLGSVEVFPVTGLERPTFDVGEAVLDEVAVAPGGTVRLVLAPKVPRGEKLDASLGAPLRIAVAGGESAEGPGPRLDLKLRAAAGEIRAEAAVVTCSEGVGAVCRMNRSRVAIPVRLDDTAPSSVDIAL